MTGTTTGRLASAEPPISNTPKAASLTDALHKSLLDQDFSALELRALGMQGKRLRAKGWKPRERIFTEHDRRTDTYRLAEALKPTDPVLHLCLVDLMSPLPVLCTYKGDATGALVRHAIYP